VSRVIVRNATRDRVLGTRVQRADTFRLRLLGLMFCSGLAEGEGLVIRPCKAVHTHFMRFPIDVLFLDAAGRVVHLVPALKPWKQSPYVKQAVAVLELSAGAAGETAVGDQLEMA
jgi:uncharacterized membrane protein (UPF0127 family)